MTPQTRTPTPPSCYGGRPASSLGMRMGRYARDRELPAVSARHGCTGLPDRSRGWVIHPRLPTSHPLVAEPNRHTHLEQVSPGSVSRAQGHIRKPHVCVAGHCHYTTAIHGHTGGVYGSMRCKRFRSTSASASITCVALPGRQRPPSEMRSPGAEALRNARNAHRCWQRLSGSGKGRVIFLYSRYAHDLLVSDHQSYTR